MRQCALSELAGVPTLIDQAGLMDVPQAHVAVLDGNALASWRRAGRQRATARRARA